MAKLSESGGCLLEKTSVVLGSNLGNAHWHDPRHLSIFVAGDGYEHGSYVAYDTDRHTSIGDTCLCSFVAKLLNNTGVDSERLGASSGVPQISMMFASPR